MTPPPPRTTGPTPATSCTGVATTAEVRQSYVLGAVGAYLRQVTEVDDPADARLVARGRALFDAYLEETE